MFGSRNCATGFGLTNFHCNFTQGLEDPKTGEKAAKPSAPDWPVHEITKCGYMCIECRAAHASPNAFLKFRCKHNQEDHGRLICATYMCKQCPLMGNNYEFFKNEVCPRTGPWAKLNPEKLPAKAYLLPQPKCLQPSFEAAEKPILPVPKRAIETPPEVATPAPTPLQNEIPKKVRRGLSLCDPPSRTPPRKPPQEDEALAQALLLSELEAAQKELENLVMLQSLQEERERLAKLLQQQQKQEHAGDITAGLRILTKISPACSTMFSVWLHTSILSETSNSPRALCLPAAGPDELETQPLSLVEGNVLATYVAAAAKNEANLQALEAVSNKAFATASPTVKKARLWFFTHIYACSVLVCACVCDVYLHVCQPGPRG